MQTEQNGVHGLGQVKSSAGITTGVWSAIPWNTHAATTVVAIQDGQPLVVAECSGHGRNADDSVADARVIAESKNLLTQLEHFVRWHDQISPKDIEAAKALIAKVHGGAPALITPAALNPVAMADAQRFGAGLDDLSLEQSEAA